MAGGLFMQRQKVKAYDVSPFVPHWDERQDAITQGLDAAGPGAVLLLGDSISEAAPFHNVAGHPLVNGGIAAIRQRQLADRAEVLLEHSHCSIAILFGGKNTARSDVSQEERDSFKTDTLRIAKAARASGAQVIFCTVPPTEPGMLLSNLYPPALTVYVNDVIQEVAGSLSSPVVDVNALFRGADGWAREGVTKDGIHLTPSSYADLKIALDQAVRTVRS